MARLVIIGAGIVGSSAACHLVKLGWRDILVLDKGNLEENPGSTSHAPGGVVALSHSKLLTQMAQYSSDLYRNLRPFSPDRNSYNAVGGLEIAISERRFNDLKRLHGEGKSFGTESHLLSPKETKDKLPLLDDRAIVGALFVPRSAIIAGSHVTSALQRDAAAMGGASFIGHAEVTDIEVKNGRVIAVVTNHPGLPRVECEAVLLCTNIWGPVLGDKLGVPIPLLAFEHQYTVTTPIEALAKFDPNRKEDEIIFPTARELDSSIYFRQHWNSYGVGNYWHTPRPVRPQNVGGDAKRPFTPEDFTKCWKQVTRLLPALQGAELATKFNGMFAFPVDGMPIMGESHIKGLWTAVGSWITHAGGVGKSIAEWMTYGEGATEWDMRQTNLHRFQPFQTTRAYIDVICNKNYAELYDIVHPCQPLSKPRDVRLSPFHPRWQALGASFTAFAGLELPNWCEENARLLEKYDERIPERTGWAAEYWSRVQGAEHLATRDSVALYDLTGLSIFEVRGKGALKFVNTLCSNQMDVRPGRVVYTCWLTNKGGVRRDLAVARLSDDRFWMFVGEGTRPQDWVWVNRLAPDDGTLVLTDISDSYTALGLWGPNARSVLQKVTHADPSPFGSAQGGSGQVVSNTAFPYFTAQWIDIGCTPVLALRLSYVGELGWELHMPVDQALPVWDVLWEAGREFGIVGAGMGAFDSLRLEKGYRLWGGDVYTEHTPYEAGLGWTVKLDKPDFIGREACLKLKANGALHKKLCCLTLDDPKAVVMGAEPIFTPQPPKGGATNPSSIGGATSPSPLGEDGRGAVGYVTSANYGYSVGKTIAYGYLPIERSAIGAKVEIEYFGERFCATVSNDPIFDPKMERLKR
jgi:glycine cleavage system aminomethyltransferase T/glycine/D-amino acid oxidase-like deaminating enzyme